MENKIAQTIKFLRNELHITQKQLADETGISISTIIAYENSKREPNSKNMAILENYFKVSGAFLRGETDIRDPMIWEDQEIMETIKEGLPKQLSDLSALIINQTEKNQKLIFDILVEIKSILDIEDDKDKEFYIDLVHENIAAIKTVRSKANKESSTTTK